jgi:tRNA(Arg) A34 adenosine deaminase TadA
MTTASSSWSALSPAWRAAFDEAWASWCAGCFGIGAVLTDSDGDVVSRGRNRTAERRSEAGVLAGNFTAHAEMNAFAAMPRWSADGLDLYTTLQPCLMCAATAVAQSVARVHVAAADPFFAGIDELWTHHPFTAQRCPVIHGAFEPDDGLGVFARLLPYTFILLWIPDGPAAQVYRDRDAAVAELATDLVAHGFAELAEAKKDRATTSEALSAIWPRLPT